MALPSAFHLPVPRVTWCLSPSPSTLPQLRCVSPSENLHSPLSAKIQQICHCQSQPNYNPPCLGMFSFQSVPGVMAAVANLLRVPINTYDETRMPERSSLALLAGVKVPPSQGALFSQQHLHRPPAPSGHPGMMIQGAPPALGRPPSTGKTTRTRM